MSDTLQLQLVSPERMLVDEPVSEVQAPALDGFIGVLPGHAPLVSELKPGGVLSYRTSGGEKKVAVFGGFVEVLPDRVRILADGAQFREEIDANAARAELGKATTPEEQMRAQAKIDAAASPSSGVPLYQRPDSIRGCSQHRAGALRREG
jgi:F-type H+-transporting ATPase subunit epsilon